ncbi:MAG: two-component regulator propeller domain-containing protein [Prevotella sp.]
MSQQNRWGYTRLNNNDGLSNSSINTILQDSDGVMWFGTWDGINGYDGRIFNQYTAEYNNELSLSHPVIRDIVEEDNRHLWIVTDWGLNRFDKITKQSTHYFLGNHKKAKFKEKLFKCVISPKGQIVANYDHGILQIFDSRTKKFNFLLNPKLHTGPISLITFDHQGYLWMTFRSYLLKTAISTSGNITIHQKVLLPKDLKRIFCDNERTIWMQSSQRLYSLSSDGRWTAFPWSTQEDVTGVCNTRIGYCFGTENGCFILQNGRAVHLLKGISVTALFWGSQKILWIGTDGQGVFQYFEKTQFINTLDIVNPTFPVRAVLRQGSTLYVGSKGGGLTSYEVQKNGKLQFNAIFNVGEGKSYNSVFALAQGLDGRIWIGTDGYGLSYLSNGAIHQMQFLDTASQKKVYSIYAIIQADDSILYLGSSGSGLIKLTFSDNKVTHLTHYNVSNRPNSLNSNVVYALIDDGQYLWIGTRGGGLCQLDKLSGQLHHYKHEKGNAESLSSNDIISMLKDSQGRLWIGTTQGLNLMHKSNGNISFECFDEEKGLPNMNIHSIQEDCFHHIWVSTSNGLSRISLEASNIINFTYRDGLQGNEFSDGAGFAYNKGLLLYFGGTNGLNSINPNMMRKDRFIPKLMINRLLVNNYEIPFDRHKIVIEPNAQTIQINFSVLNYIDNDRSELQYKLVKKGFISDDDKADWISIGSGKFIILNKLQPGNYQLIVRQSNVLHQWATSPLVVPIKVKFPLWARWWAILIYILLIIVVIRLLYISKKSRILARHQDELERQRRNSLEEIHQAKLRFFSNVTGKFSNNITQIYDAIERIRRQSPDLNCLVNVQNIEKNIKKMNRHIKQLVEIQSAEESSVEIVTEKIDLVENIKYILDNFTDTIHTKKINLLIPNHSGQFNIISDKGVIQHALYQLFSYITSSINRQSTLEIIFEKTDKSIVMHCAYQGDILNPEDFENVFNRYKALEKFESKLSRGENDSTISLTVCNDLLQRIGGELRMETPASSTIVLSVTVPMLELPATQTDANEASQGSAIEQIMQKERRQILLIENDNDMTALLQQILSSDYHILCVTDENEAKKQLAATYIDLILYDPNHNNVDFILELRKDERMKYVPIIVLATEGDQQKHINSLYNGADAVIEKPFHSDYLRAVVARFISTIDNMMEFSSSTEAYLTHFNHIEMSETEMNFLKTAINALNHHFDDENYNPDMLASDMAISRTQLYRKMKQIIGLTPNDFITEFRMKQAQKMLIYSDKTISQVIADSGFRNRAFFYRKFMQQYGCSPGKYRQDKKQ